VLRKQGQRARQQAQRGGSHTDMKFHGSPVRQNGRWKEVILTGNPRQRIPRRTELRRQLQRGAVLLGGAAAVALLLQKLSQQEMGLEGRRIFGDGIAGQIVTHHLYGPGKVASCDQEHRSAVEFGNSYVTRGCERLSDRGLHVLGASGAAVV